MKIPYVPPKSPTKTNEYVERLLDILDVEFEPEIIPVKVESGNINSCYYIVERKVKRDGGKICYGWGIWQSNYIVEAQHHAVWEDEEGNLLDISPKTVQTDTIMFVPDNRQVYQGQYIFSKRLNITNNPVIDDLITMSSARDMIFSFGERIEEYQLALPFIAQTYGAICKQTSDNFLRFYLNGGKRSSNCYCGSHISFKNCCGKDVKGKAKQYIATVKKALSK